MKQLLILSGKGGTGKTTIASAFIKLAKANVYADCDVDAPNLHLIMTETVKPLRKDYFGMPKAKIDPELCINCDKCMEHCMFNSIIADGKTHSVDPFACEGCGVCEFVCPVGAVSMKDYVAGDLMLFKDEQKVFSTAQLKMGNGTTGLLVSEVKKQMKKEAKKDADLAIIDGSPGIGCPVIASLSGVDMVLIVAEPSVSGISDMDRVIQVARKFGTQIAVCINKSDTNNEKSKEIQAFCVTESIPFVGNIPFDRLAVKAVNSGLSIIEIDCPSGTAVRDVYKKTMHILFSDGGR